MTKISLYPAAVLAIVFMSGNTKADLILGTFNTPVVVDFNTFNGTGFAPSPAAGQLNSSTWRVTGMSDGAGTFGGTHTTDDFARGTSAAGVGTGGVYAFEHATGNFMLGFQPTGDDFTPGGLTVRLLNSTGSTITDLAVSYDILVFNDQGRSSSFNFAHSADDSTYNLVSGLNYTTPEIADTAPVAWTTIQRQTTLTGLNIASGSQYYLQWQSDDVGGSGSRDQFGLDNLSISAVPEPTSLSVLGLGLIGLICRRRRM